MTEQEIRRYLRQMQSESSQAAFHKFYNLCFDRFFRIAYHYLHKEEWSQEVVLDVFLKIWEKREELHKITHLEDYFFITVKNAALNYLDKESKRKDNLLARPFLPDDKKYNYYFYDINAKVNHKFSDRSRLFLSFYKGKDHYDYKQDKEYDGYSNDGPRMYTYNSKINFNWGNTIAAGRWNYVFNNKLFSNTTVAYNHYQMLMADSYNKEITGTGHADCGQTAFTA